MSMTGEPGRSVQVLAPRPRATWRLIAFPYAGGEAAVFRGWPAALPEWIEVHAVQLPGRGRRMLEAPLDRVTEMTATIAAALRPVADRPCAFYGHSLGGLIAYEVARELRRQGVGAPQHLFLGACLAPHRHAVKEPIHLLGDNEFLGSVLKLGGTPPEVFAYDELRELLLPGLRADFGAWETYVYQPDGPLQCPITAVGGTGDTSVATDDIRAWREQTTGEFNLHWLPGDHFFLRTSERELLHIIESSLARQR